jgi:hypothetical protein
MKFNLLIALFGLVSGQQEETLSEKWSKVVNDLDNFAPNTWEAIKTTAGKIPRMRHENRMRDQIDPDTGKPFTFRKNSDIDREYDRAIYRVYALRENMGYAAPHEIFREGSTDKPGNVCEDKNPWGFATGIAKGLQYNSRRPSECYLNIETTML